MATKGTKVPAIKNIPTNLDFEVKSTLESMKEALEVRLGRRGDPRDRAITLRELIESGLAKELTNNPFNPNAPGGGGFGPPDEPPGDLTTPPAPFGLTANGAFTAIILDWNGMSASAPYGNHAFTEIWRSQSNELAGAVFVASTNAFVYTDEVGYNKTYYYWVRYVSDQNIPGPFNDTNGAEGVTLESVEEVMTALTEEIKNLPGFLTLNTDMSITLAGVNRTLQATFETVNDLAQDAQDAVDALESINAPSVIRSDDPPTVRPDGTSLLAGDIWFETDNNNQIYVYTGSTWSTTASGASSSIDETLQSEIDANGLAISSNASNILLVAGVSGAQNISTSINITSLNSAITDSTTGLAANASAINQLTTRVDDVDVDISTLSNSVTALQATVTGYNGTNTIASAINGLQIQITANDGDISANATAVTNLNLALTGYTGSGAVATAISGLQTSINTNAGDIVSISNNVIGLTNSLSTTNSTKNQTFVQTSAPTAIAVGDLWIDSDDNNKLYRWDGSTWEEVADTSGIAIYAQNSQPTGANEGDLWFDTDDDNRQYRWDGTQWAEVTDPRIGLKTTTFVQSTVPTSTAIGDTWIHTGSSNQLYVARSIGADQITAGEWEDAQDGEIAANSSAINTLESEVSLIDGTLTSNSAAILSLQNALSGYTGSGAVASAFQSLTNTVTAIPVNFRQANAPTGTLTEGDLWIDTDDNQLYRYNGSSWQTVRDSVITANSQAITTLQATVNNSNTGVAANASAIDALEITVTGTGGHATRIGALETTVNNSNTGVAANASAISSLETTVETKNKSFAQVSAPGNTSGNDLKTGDLWIETDNNNKLYRWNGATWAPLSPSTVTTFAQNNQPTANLVGDLWFDTDDDNKLYRWNGSSWVEVRDDLISSNATAITAVQSEIGITFDGRLRTTDGSEFIDIQTMSGGSTVNHNITAADVTTGVFVALRGFGSVGGFSEIQINRTHKVIEVINATRLKVEAAGATATSSVNPSTRITDGVLIGTNAGVLQLAETTTNTLGQTEASYVLQVNSNGHIAGFAIQSSTGPDGQQQSDVIVQADRFTLVPSTGVGEVAPFIVDAGVVYIDTARIKDGAIENVKIKDATIETAKLKDAVITNAKIADANITNAKIADATIQGAKIVTATITDAHIFNLSAEKITSDFLDADRIEADSITATKIETTDLFLPSRGGEKTGPSIGYFHDNDFNYRQIAEIGSGAGFYQGFARIYKGSYAGQVKTIVFMVSDGTYGASYIYDVNTGVYFYDVGPNFNIDGKGSYREDSASHVVFDTPHIGFLTGNWIPSGRLTSTRDSGNIPLAFRYTGTGTLNFFIGAQGDSNYQYVGGVDVRFIKFST
jgi:hypothetical protein